MAMFVSVSMNEAHVAIHHRVGVDAVNLQLLDRRREEGIDEFLDDRK
eukprot:CAMPEP_0117518490 /NCGR_PEP_ID=MMETSP0784-20121206/32159_1 /TAXON_ID=39447 /ORGANISM="" /LENGTH=46 /DNA_ID= /DNA_START= /DNA_END= /DNA_ORIENTATION=